MRLPARQYRGSVKGRTNRANTGKGFEGEIEATLREYRRLGLAYIHKSDPPMRIAGDRVIFQRNPFLDYVGILPPGGRGIMFEAKSTLKHAYLPIARRTSSGRPYRRGFTIPQWEVMNAFGGYGGIVFLLWKYVDETRLFMKEQINQAVGGNISFCEGELVPYRNGFLDFLSIAI